MEVRAKSQRQMVEGAQRSDAERKKKKAKRRFGEAFARLVRGLAR